MKKIYLVVFLLGALVFRAQTICNSTGNLMLYTNYDGGTLTINVDQNIPNLKIGICSYEAVYISFTGAFLSNVTGIRYAGYNGTNNTSCGAAIPTTTIVGAPGTAVTSTVYAPASPLANTNGYGSIICGYSCSNNTNQGGCNTVDQVEAYFLSYFSGSSLYAHKVQYGCWTGTQSLSVGGNCCPPPPVYPGVITSSQTVCAGTVPSGFLSSASATVGSGTIGYQWQSSTTSASTGFTNISGATANTYNPGALSQTTYYRRAASTNTANVAYSNVLVVTVLPLPLLSVSGATSVCSGYTTTLTATGGTSYIWNPGGSTNASLMLTPASSTVVSVTAFGANGCSVSLAQPVLIIPTPTLSVASSTVSACSGQTATLMVSGGTSYTWIPGFYSTSTVTLQALSPTIFTVLAQSANGCVTQSTISLLVAPLPTLGITTTPTLVCTGKLLTLNASGGTSYTWTPGPLSGGTITLTPQSAAFYTLTGFDGFCRSSFSFSVDALPSPTVELIASLAKLCKGEQAVITPTGASTYTLSNTASVISGSISVTPTITTSYGLIGIAANGCSGSTVKTLTVSNCTGIENETSIRELEIKLYPNPNSGEFFISSVKPRVLNLYTASGQLIRRIELTESTNYTVAIKSIAAGIYFIASADALQSYRQKIVVTE